MKNLIRIVVFSILFHNYSAIAQDFEKVIELRSEIATDNIEYTNNLTGFDLKLKQKELQDLRVELGVEIENLVEAGTGGEFELALRYTEFELKIKNLNLIENRFGGHEGNISTIWNVLDDDQLKKVAKTNNRSLKHLLSRAEVIPKSEVPHELILRIEEVQNWNNAIKAEQTRRKDGRKPLKGLRSNLNDIESAGLNNLLNQPTPEDKKLHRLYFNLEKRSARNPNNPNLNVIKDKLFDKVRFNPVSFDIESIKKRGPPSSFDECLKNIRESFTIKIDALIQSDLGTMVEANVQLRLNNRWLEIATKNNQSTIKTSNEFYFAPLESLSLQRTKLSKHLLEIEKVNIDKDFYIEKSIVNKSIDEINESYNKRLQFFPFDNAFLVDQPQRGPPPSKTLLKLNQKWNSFTEFYERVEYKKVLDMPLVWHDIKLADKFKHRTDQLSKNEDHIHHIYENLDSKVNTLSQDIKQLANVPSADLKPTDISSDANRGNNALVEYFKDGVKKSESIKLEKVQLPDFDQTFDKTKTLDKHFFKKNLKFAPGVELPGGIIIDAVIPQKFLNNIEDFHYDVISEVLLIKVSGTWEEFTNIDPITVRQHYLYVKDGRRVAVDLRSDSTSTTVNLHPTFLNTSFGKLLIGADTLMNYYLQKALYNENSNTSESLLKDGYIADNHKFVDTLGALGYIDEKLLKYRDTCALRYNQQLLEFWLYSDRVTLDSLSLIILGQQIDSIRSEASRIIRSLNESDTASIRSLIQPLQIEYEKKVAANDSLEANLKLSQLNRTYAEIRCEYWLKKYLRTQESIDSSTLDKNILNKSIIWIDSVLLNESFSDFEQLELNFWFGSYSGFESQDNLSDTTRSLITCKNNMVMNWFAENKERIIRENHPLSDVMEKVKITALIQSIVEYSIPNNLDELLYFIPELVSTPDIIYDGNQIEELTKKL